VDWDFIKVEDSMDTNQPINCSARGCSSVFMPEQGLPPTLPAEARRWRLVTATDGTGEQCDPMAFCPEHHDITELTSVGAHSLHHARWDSKVAAKYQVVIIKADGTAIPADEPVMIFRARDPLAVPAIRTYLQLAGSVLNAAEREMLKKRVAEFESYDDKRMPGAG
jgi:hypothetical protein